jgi:hypothetical protein
MGGKSYEFDPEHPGKRTFSRSALNESQRMERELEALAREDDARSAARRPRGAPIGALPTAGEPLRRDGIAQLADVAQQNTRMIGESLRDILKALARIARLPIEAALIAARRFRPAHG